MPILLTDKAMEDYVSFSKDHKIMQKIGKLIDDIRRNGVLMGAGNPEALKYGLTGWYSREIDSKNRLVYRVLDDGTIEIQSLKGHYKDK
ncbi:MAG: Txe/YoeB family addiction module toxin [Oscillospiraceae bacterium]|nr:Txe/YoeB family addiction module toxin [Oscillospiraceae bacterium]